MAKIIEEKTTVQKTSRSKTALNENVVKQYKVFRKLIKKAAKTDFGKQFLFEQILTADYDLALFKKLVPVYTYETLYQQWWKRVKRGDKDVCWPGKIKYFALSSGTSSGSSKIIPVSKQMLKTIRKTSLKQITSLKKLGVTNKSVRGEVLMIGGSTKLEEKNNRFFGDMSGISMLNALPRWFLKKYYRPGYAISDLTDWDKRLNEIVLQAKKWNIAVICGMPNWVYLLIEKIVTHYKVETIHEIWPKLQLYVHGGVFFQPYQSDFEKLLKYPLNYAETYMASEGFFGFSTSDSKGGIQLVLDGNIFFEFIPYDNVNFDEHDCLRPNATPITIQQVKKNTNYALVITNNAGAWRYLIGDIIQFVNTETASIKIIGRLGQTLNVCGEHVSATNLIEAYNRVSENLEIESGEFTVVSHYSNGNTTHHWFICGNKVLAKLPIAHKLDKSLMLLNHDYAVARKANLLKPVVHIIPKRTMTQWLAHNGRAGNQYKMPVILSQDKIQPWLEFNGISL